jgi:hypothetical protein
MALAQDLDWRPAREVPDPLDPTAGWTPALSNHLPRQFSSHV